MADDSPANFYWSIPPSVLRTRGANILHYKYIAQARTRLDCDSRLEKMREVNAKHGSANIKGRGRPQAKVKRIQGSRSRAQLARFNKSIGLDDEDQQWQCSCCKYPGHTRTCT